MMYCTSSEACARLSAERERESFSARARESGAASRLERALGVALGVADVRAHAVVQAGLETGRHEPAEETLEIGLVHGLSLKLGHRLRPERATGTRSQVGRRETPLSPKEWGLCTFGAAGSGPHRVTRAQRLELCASQDLQRARARRGNTYSNPQTLQDGEKSNSQRTQRVACALPPARRGTTPVTA